MKWYVFMDAGGELLCKSKEFIETECPNFKDLHGSILRHWVVETSEPSSCMGLLHSLKDLQIRPEIISSLAESLGMDLKVLREYVGKIRSGREQGTGNT